MLFLLWRDGQKHLATGHCDALCNILLSHSYLPELWAESGTTCSGLHFPLWTPIKWTGCSVVWALLICFESCSAMSSWISKMAHTSFRGKVVLYALKKKGDIAVSGEAFPASGYTGKLLSCFQPPPFKTGLFILQVLKLPRWKSTPNTIPFPSSLIQVKNKTISKRAIFKEVVENLLVIRFHVQCVLGKWIIRVLVNQD